MTPSYAVGNGHFRSKIAIGIANWHPNKVYDVNWTLRAAFQNEGHTGLMAELRIQDETESIFKTVQIDEEASTKYNPDKMFGGPIVREAMKKSGLI